MDVQSEDRGSKDENDQSSILKREESNTGGNPDSGSVSNVFDNSYTTAMQNNIMLGSSGSKAATERLTPIDLHRAESQRSLLSERTGSATARSAPSYYQIKEYSAINNLLSIIIKYADKVLNSFETNYDCE